VERPVGRLATHDISHIAQTERRVETLTAGIEGKAGEFRHVRRCQPPIHGLSGRP
jgi:hypothetical protein